MLQDYSGNGTLVNERICLGASQVGARGRGLELESVQGFGFGATPVDFSRVGGLRVGYYCRLLVGVLLLDYHLGTAS